MGQRLQAFIYTHNPVFSWEQQLKRKPNAGLYLSPAEKKAISDDINKLKTALGNDPHTTLAYHHQWIYGKSALIAATNILLFNKNAREENNPFSLNSIQQTSPESFLNFTTHLLGLFVNPLATEVGRFGFERFHLLNFTEPGMRLDIRRGDNNDGVFIVDTVTNKYAFLNIGGDSTINQLALLEPVSAKEYLLAYYPEAMTDFFCEKNDGKSEMEREEIIQKNRELNLPFIELFNGFEILTKKELQIMYPATYEKIQC